MISDSFLRCSETMSQNAPPRAESDAAACADPSATRPDMSIPLVASTASSAKPSASSTVSATASSTAVLGLTARNRSRASPTAAYVVRMSPGNSSTACASPSSPSPASRRRNIGVNGRPRRAAESTCSVKL